MRKWLTRILEWLFAAVLVAVGLIGVFHEVLHRVGIEPKNPESFVLRIVGLLALALGLERFTRFAHLERHFSALERRLAVLSSEVHERLAVRIIEGNDHVYNEAIRLFQTAESSIRTFVYAKGPTAPERYVYALIERMRQQKLLTYHVTVALDLSIATAEFWVAHEKRAQYYREGGVADRAQVTILDTTKPVGFDVILIDEKHCGLAFSAVPVPEMNKEVGIYFENQPQITKRIRAWLENLTPQLITVDEARKRWQRKHRGQSSAT